VLHHDGSLVSSVITTSVDRRSSLAKETIAVNRPIPASLSQAKLRIWEVYTALTLCLPFRSILPKETTLTAAVTRIQTTRS